MKTILPNIWMLLFRIALLGLFIYMYQWPLQKIRQGTDEENLAIFIVGLIVVSMFPFYLLWTLFKVMWVRLSIDDLKIHFHYLHTSVKIHSSDIDGYFKTIHRTRIKSYSGLLIRLKTGKVLEVSEYNVKSIEGIKGFLQTYKIPYRGEKSSWFPFTRKV